MSKAKDLASLSGLMQVVPTSVTVDAGSASVSATGAITISSANTIIVNNVFSSSYLNYKIIWNLTAVSGNDIIFRFCSNGASTDSGYVGTGTTTNYTTGAVGAYGANTVSGVYLSQVTTTGATGQVEVFGPYTSGYKRTTHSGSGTNGIHNGGLYQSGTTLFDGFKFTWASSAIAMSGTIRIYGYNNGGA